MIGLTFFLLDNQKHPDRCEILLDSYCDCTSSGREAKAAEQIVVAALKALRLEQTVYVVREGSHSAAKGKLTFSTTPRGRPDGRGTCDQWLRLFRIRDLTLLATLLYPVTNALQDLFGFQIPRRPAACFRDVWLVRV